MIPKNMNDDEEEFQRIMERWRGKLEPWQVARNAEIRAEQSVKDIARAQLSRAVRSGKVKKPTVCERCAQHFDDPHFMTGHHTDYAKPLDVQWLCRPCHALIHAVTPRPYAKVAP